MGRRGHDPSRMMRRLLLAALAILAIANDARASAATTGDTASCVIKSNGDLFNGIQGILINGQCYAAPDGADPDPADPGGSQYRSVICAQPAGSGTTSAITDCIAPATCPDGVAWQTEVNSGSGWEPVGPPWCPQGGSAPAPPPQPTVAQIRQQALRLLPQVAIGSAPDGAGLTNAETVLWADTESDRSLPTVRIVGQQVELRISFDHAMWQFGDGASDTTDSPGRAYDEASDPCETAQCPGYYGHTYTATGRVTVTLIVGWHAQYRLAGQDWIDVDTAPLTGPADQQSLTIRQARGVLVH